MKPTALDRRSFLVGLGGILAGFATGPRLASAGEASSPGQVEILRAPLILGPGDHLVDRSFRLADDFAWNRATNAAIFIAAPRVRIQNVRLIGSDTWLPRWNRYQEPKTQPPGIAGTLAGVRFENASGLRIGQLSIEGFPRAAITGFGLHDAEFSDIQVQHCFSALRLEPYVPSRGLLAERIHVRDMWGPAPGGWPGIQNAPSQARPGGWMGGTAFALNSLSEATLRDCSVEGEQHGSFKLVRPMNVEMLRLRGSSLGVWGSSDRQLEPGARPARGILVRDCTLDKRRGKGRQVEQGNCMTVAWNVAEISIARCSLRGDGQNGHGIVFLGNSHGEIRECTIRGFNGKRGLGRAFAIRVEAGSGINADAEDVNHFVDQDRVLKMG